MVNDVDVFIFIKKGVPLPLHHLLETVEAGFKFFLFLQFFRV